jgi:lysophospholipase L1-like esterase
MRRWHIVLLIVGTVIALTALISLGTTRPSTMPAGPPAIKAGDEYVAIGDSYTAAPATGPAAANNGCWQSTTNYPHQVAKTLRLNLTDVSCGGATTQHVVSAQVHGAVNQPPQGDALSPSTDLVTISLGGNDFLAISMIVYSCTAARAQDPSGAPCQRSSDSRGGATEKSIARIQGHLVSVIKYVAHRAPDARIIMVGYPEFFPPAGPCGQLPLARGDYPFARRVNQLLVRAQKRAAERSNVEYVDVYTPSRGHHMCARDPWIAGLHPTRSDATPFHPYPEEQRLVAELLVERLS